MVPGTLFSNAHFFARLRKYAENKLEIAREQSQHKHCQAHHQRDEWTQQWVQLKSQKDQQEERPRHGRQKPQQREKRMSDLIINRHPLTTRQKI